MEFPHKPNTDERKKMHVVVFPYLAFGHMIPYLELAKFLAQRGHKVSFVSTPRNIQRLPKPPPHLSPLIDFVKLALPRVEEIPAEAESTMDVRSDDIQYLKKAYDGLAPELAQFLRSYCADWILHDFSCHWLPPIAAELGIPTAFFNITAAWFPAFLGSSSMMLNGSDPRSKPEDFTVPPEWVRFPTKIAFRLFEIKRLLSSGVKNASGVSDPYRVGSTIAGCKVIAVRQCREFESEWLDLLGEMNDKPVIPLGLIPPSLQDSGDEKSETWVSISEWLGKQRVGSVVYVALGSEASLSQEELTELALGLELSGLPFLWVFRKPPGSDESDSVELPEGFEERTKGRGAVWRSWVPQLKILGHDSVGGFLTHCGWGSVIEGLQFGRPLIMLPLVIDNGLNGRVFGDKVGLEIRRDDEDGSFSRETVAETLKRVIVEEEGKSYRDKAKEMQAIFGDKERQDKYLHSFVDYLESHRRQCNDPILVKDM